MRECDSQKLNVSCLTLKNLISAQGVRLTQHKTFTVNTSVSERATCCCHPYISILSYRTMLLQVKLKQLAEVEFVQTHTLPDL